MNKIEEPLHDRKALQHRGVMVPSGCHGGQATEPRKSVGFRIETTLGRLYVESIGVGPTIIAWPSLFFAGVTLCSQIDTLARDYRVILIDPPGHGRSDSPACRFSLADCAHAALNVLDEVGIERAAFLGASWGGAVGVAMALHSPERLRGLVLMNAPMHGFTRRERLQFSILSQLFRTLGPRAFLIRSVTSAQLSEEVRRAQPALEVALADCLRAADRRALTLAMRSSLLSMPSLYPRLGELHLPTLVLTGARDTVIDVEQARSAADAIAGSCFEVVQRSAHQSGFEAPEVVNPIIAKFLLSLRP